MQDSVDSTLDRLKSIYSIVDTVYCDGLNPIDLYVRIKKLYQTTYDNDQKIVFVITQDHHKENEPGILLQNLQAIISDIDISNFFVIVVTTNQDIEKHYKNVFENFSTDPVPFSIEICQGVYHKHHSNVARISLKKYSHIRDQDEIIRNLDPEKKNLLFESDVFCLMPWLGIHISPGSVVKPCCESSLKIGNCKDNTLSEIWNSNTIKETRKKMLAGERVKSCESCYVKESFGRHTLRKSTNEKFLRHVDKINLTKSDGHLDDFDLKYWDIRYNNLCNLACRSCNPKESSSWHQAAIYLNQVLPSQPMTVVGNSAQDVFQQVMSHINSVEAIYFAGGEPLIIEEFYDTLEQLIRLGRTDVRLMYNTNLTKLRLKSKYILDLWKEFPNVSIGASLDAEGSRGEYIRQNCDWNDIVSNRLTMMEKCPHIDFYVSATTGILNVLHLPDFHRSWVDKGLIETSGFDIQMLFHPGWMNIESVPDNIKQRIREKYTKHLDWLDPLDHLGRASYGFRSVLKQIDSHRDFDAKTFWHNIDALDKFYNQDFTSTFPELFDLPRS